MLPRYILLSVLLIAPALASASVGAGPSHVALGADEPALALPREPDAACEPGVGCLPEAPYVVDERGDKMTGPLEMTAAIIMSGNQADLLDPVPPNGPVEIVLEAGTRAVVQSGAQLLVEDGGEARIADGATLVIEAASGLALPQAELEVPGNVLPAETNTFALGSPALRWTDLFLDSQINYIGDLEFVAEGGLVTMVLTPTGELTVLGSVLGEADRAAMAELTATVDALNAEVAGLGAQVAAMQAIIDEMRGRVHPGN